MNRRITQFSKEITIFCIIAKCSPVLNKLLYQNEIIILNPLYYSWKSNCVALK